MTVQYCIYKINYYMKQTKTIFQLYHARTSYILMRW